MTADNAGAQASSGGCAFGDSVFVFVFGVVGLVPTGFALYFSRPVRRFWTGASIGALAFAASGVAASVLFLTTCSQLPAQSLLVLAAALSFERIVGPLVAAAFLICAGFAPSTGPRRAFAITTFCEGAAAAPFFLWVAYRILLQ